VEDYEDDKLWPALPSHEDVDNKTLFEEYLNNCYSSKDQGRFRTPAPPLHDSSKDYTRWNTHYDDLLSSGGITTD